MGAVLSAMSLRAQSVSASSEGLLSNTIFVVLGYDGMMVSKNFIGDFASTEPVTALMSRLPNIDPSVTPCKELQSLLDGIEELWHLLDEQTTPQDPRHF